MIHASPSKTPHREPNFVILNSNEDSPRAYHAHRVVGNDHKCGELLPQPSVFACPYVQSSLRCCFLLRTLTLL